MILVLLFVLLIAAPLYSSDSENFYIGAEACAPCHQVESENLSKTPHFAAFDTLVKKAEDDDASCYWCHTVGFSEKGGFLNAGLTPELEGVQCESCHGRGGKHVRERQKYSAPTLKVCVNCHTSDINPDFDPEKKWEKIRH